MFRKKVKVRRVISSILAAAMLFSVPPVMDMTVEATGSNAEYVADAATLHNWRNYFEIDATGDLSTEHAGSVWTDKSVFTDAAAFGKIEEHTTGSSLEFESNGENFLVALSAISSDTTVTGKANKATDTMIVLDLSSSMYRSQTDTEDETFYPETITAMLDSVNETISNLQNLNEHNRVGVAVYFGDGTFLASDKDNSLLMLPLDRYVQADEKYLTATISDGALVSVQSNSKLKNSAGESVAVTKRTFTKVAGTYMQLGILEALNQFLRTDIDTKIPADADYQAGEERTAVMVLMSDGEPTAATANYTQMVDAGMGNNTVSIRNAAETDFVTQLTASYAKEMMDRKYVSTTPIFYTLSLGNSISWDVMDPANTLNKIDTTKEPTTKITGYWEKLVKNNSVNITVQNRTTAWGATSADATYTVSKAWLDAGKTETFPASVNQRLYVDKAFTAENSDAFDEAFDSIMEDITVQTHYYPTLVEDNENLGGYVSFVDKIGKYMKVTDIKGILLDDVLYTGVGLAENFVAGGGSLGTYTNPTKLGDNLVWSLQQRLGLKDVTVARSLLGLAYDHGQMSYTSPDEFSNYIGWYANEKDEYLGFWYDGITTMPDPDDPSLDDETRPKYIVKSYLYLGVTDAESGVANSDMMYITVRVREDIETGEQTVAFAVPASLIPIISYDITLDENEWLEDLGVSGAQHPIRLLYEVELDEKINETTILDPDIVDTTYYTSEKDSEGYLNFYSNQYEKNNSTGYNHVNTYSYFRPSRQNGRYYAQEDLIVYQKNADGTYTEYASAARPSGTGYYREYTIYKKVDGKFQTEKVYRELAADVLVETTQKGNNWYVPHGSVFRNLDTYRVYKDGANAGSAHGGETDTLIWVDQPFVDVNETNIDAQNHRYLVGATLGNNGKLRIKPAAGIKLTKEISGVHTRASGMETFEFVIMGASSENTEYAATKLDADGVSRDATVTFTNGVAKVTLKAGETLYITGMTAGNTYTIKETDTEYYKVAAVNGETKTSIDVTLAEGQLSEAAFTNTAKGEGDLTITKWIEHDFGTNYVIPETKKFTIEVALEGPGVAGRTFRAKDSVDTTITEKTVGEDGKFTLTLGHGEQFTLFDLPEGTKATVTEVPDSLFTVSYEDDGVAGDGVVEIPKDLAASVRVINDYNDPTPVTVGPTITIGGTKQLLGEDGQPTHWGDESFTVVLQRYNETTKKWVDVKERVTIDKDNPNFVFDMSGETYTKVGDYAYQAFEVAGDIGDMRYDPAYFSFHVIVGDKDMDGKLEIDDVVSNTSKEHITFDEAAGTWHVGTEFTNRYMDTVPALVEIELQKKMLNVSESPLVTLKGYQFGIYKDADCTQPLTESDPGIHSLVIESTDTVGEGWIDIEFDETGTYEYYIKETAGNITGMVYSKEVVKVMIVVENETSDRLKATVTYDKNYNAENQDVEFTNSYEPAVPAPVSLDVKKLLEGKALESGAFAFELCETDSNWQEKPGGDKRTATNGTEGGEEIVDFGDLGFYQVGTYYYTVKETSADGNGITTDKTVYRIIITVKDDGGRLVASHRVINVAGQEMTFENTYKPAPARYTIEGMKTLTGRTLLNNEFTFTLTEAVDASGTIEDGAKSWKSKNFANGRFEFEELKFTKPGTYHYVITETKGEFPIPGVTYDKARYVVTLEVKDDLQGALYVVDSVEITEEDEDEDGSDGQSITFVNSYVPDPASAEIPGLKRLEGKVLTEGIFSFELYESDASWKMGEKIGDSVRNSEDGTFEFALEEFTKSGTHYYLVKETNGGQTIDGITYDDAVFRVQIEVIDDMKGKLSTKVSIFDGDGEQQTGIVFKNKYVITGEEQISFSGLKELLGRELKADEFEFELKDKDGKVIETVTNDQNGVIQFAPITYTPEDVGSVFNYTVSEKEGELRDVTYDLRTYDIEVEVKDDDKGGIATAVTMEREGIAVKELSFKNIYKFEPAEVTLTAEKTVNGETPAEGLVYTFELRDENGKVLQKAKNDGREIIFDPLKFDELGVYTYTISEVTEKDENVEYDKSVYEVKINVDYNEEGSVVTTETTRIDGELKADVDTILFENIVKNDGKTPSDGTVDTGDHAATRMWLTVAVLSLAVILRILEFTKRKNVI